MKKPSPSKSDESYKVGYRRPPKAKQFRKGRSGNPRGRNSGEENLLSIFKRIATRRIRVNHDGQIKTLTLAEAIIMQNYKAALQNDHIAMGNIFRLSEQAGEFKDLSDPKVVGRPIFMPRKASSEEEFNAENGATDVVITNPNQTSVQEED